MVSKDVPFDNTTAGAQSTRLGERRERKVNGARTCCDKYELWTTYITVTRQCVYVKAWEPSARGLVVIVYGCMTGLGTSLRTDVVAEELFYSLLEGLAVILWVR